MMPGTTAPNGRPLAPFTVPPVAPRGPVSAPPRQDDPGRSGTAPDTPGRWNRAIDGDTAIRVLAAAVDGLRVPVLVPGQRGVDEAGNDGVHRYAVAAKFERR